MLNGLGAFETTMSAIASYFTVPTLGGLYHSSSGFSKVLSVAADLFSIGMPIYPDKYEEGGGTEIGTQTLVGGMDDSEGGSLDKVGALTRIMDNVVVMPRTWRIHGYMGVDIEGGGLARTVMTGGGTLPGIITKFGREALGLAIKSYIKYVADARRPFKFTTEDGETVPALIQSYAIKAEPDNLNWIDVDLQIQEFRFVGLTADGKNMVIGGGIWAETAGQAVKQLAKAGLKSLF